MNAEQLKQLAQLISSLSTKVKCPICLDYINKWAELECQHKFCSGCITQIRSKGGFACPVCKTQFTKRSPIYKDQFGEQLSKFVNRCCQFIKEKYALEVEELLSEKTNLQEVIDAAPQDVRPRQSLVKVNKCFAKPSCSKVPISKPSKNLPTFESNKNRNKIIEWLNPQLNQNHDKLDVLTQNILPDTSSDEDFQMTSISQAAAKRKSRRQRTQSWTEKKELPGPLLKRYQSLTEGLNVVDNYNIEDNSSELVVKEVERKVLQNMLEDECLENLEQAAQLVKQKSKPGSAKSKSTSPGNKTFLNISNSSSGWNRVDNIKSALKKGPGERKSLNIVSFPKSNGAVAKKLPKKKSPQEKIKKGMPNPKITRSVLKMIKKIPEKLKERVIQKNTAPLEKLLGSQSNAENPVSQSIAVMDTTAVEETVIPCKKTSPDKVEDDKIFNVPTQVTSHSVQDHMALCHIQPVPPDLNDILSVALQLNKNIKSCMSKVNDSELVDCFTNLLTYADRIADIGAKRTLNVSTQTVALFKNSVQVQTAKDVSEKIVQTSQMMSRSAHAQTDVLCFVEAGIQTSGVEAVEEKVVEEEFGSFNPGVAEEESLIVNSLSARKVTQKESSVSDSKPKNISVEASKLTKSRGTSYITSPSSPLVFSLDSTQQQTSKKLSFEESKKSSRKFKRIRKPSSDSDSDEGGNPSKRKFIKDDLTVDFIDTDKLNMTGHNSLHESEDMDYDQYLLDVMNRYDHSPPEKLLESQPRNEENEKATVVALESQKRKPVVNNKTQVEADDHVFTAATALQDHFDKFDAEIMEFERSSRADCSELDVVEGTPVEKQAPPFKPRKSEKTKNPPESQKILFKGSDVGEKIRPRSREPSETHRNATVIEVTRNDAVAEILEELRNDQDFFKSPLDTQAFSHQSNDATVNGLKNYQSEAVTEDDLNQNRPNKINVLQDVRLNDYFSEDDDTVGSSRQEGIIEETPEKNERTSREGSLASLLNALDDRFGSGEEELQENLDLCVPPPPGFGDDEELLSNTVRPIDNKGNSSPQSIPQSCRLTEFIVTPEGTPEKVEEPKEVLKKSFQLKGSQDDFSPISRCSVRLTQPSRYAPLVTTQRSSTRKPVNLMTSTPKQRSIMNFVVPYNSAPAASNGTKPCITWSRIINKDLNVFTKLECKKLVSTSKVFTEGVTHLIVLVDEKGQLVSHTAKVLMAIAAGIWVVRYEWAVDSLRQNKIVPAEPYEALAQSGHAGPKLARLNRTERPLFENFKFYCSAFFNSVSESDLESILRLSGGEIARDLGEMLRDDGKVKIVLAEITATEDNDQFDAWLEIYKVVTVEFEWLTCCLSQYQLVSFRPYLISGHESEIGDLGYPPALIESVPLTFTEQ